MVTNTDKVSLVVGFLFGFFNFWLLNRIVTGMVRSETVKKWKTALFFVLKMALLFVTIGLILKRGYVTPLPFLGGFTVSLVGGILWRLRKGSA